MNLYEKQNRFKDTKQQIKNILLDISSSSILSKEHKENINRLNEQYLSNKEMVQKDISAIRVSQEDEKYTYIQNQVSTTNKEMEALNGDLHINKTNVGTLTADVAKIENLVADKADIKDLNATNANIEKLQSENAEIKNLVADKATIGDLDAANANIKNLKVENAEIKKMVADKADIEDLNATNAEITNLKAGVAEIGQLKADVAEIDHLLAGNITAENIQAGTITAGSGIIADGAIGNAQISSIDAGKISAGKIDTSLVEIAGNNNHLKLKGNRLQVFQGTGNQAKERVSLGDVNGDGTLYGLRVRGADGTTVLIDENGVKSEGITDGSITNEKINENANIDGDKININSVVDKINEDGTKSIVGTKINVGDGTLTAKLSKITEKQTEHTNSITQAQSDIKANEKEISLKVSEQTYTADKKETNTKFTNVNSEISSMKDKIALKVESTDITNAINNLDIGGRNLLVGSSKDYTNAKMGVWNFLPYKLYINNTNLKIGDTITFKVYIKNPNTAMAGISARISFYNSSNTNTKTVSDTNYIAPNSEGFSEITTAIPGNTDHILVGFQRQNATGTGDEFVFSYKEAKLEKGSKATDWTPAPEDTQSQIDGINTNLTTNYSTTTQMNSAITASKESIELGVSKKYATTQSVTDVANNLKSNYSTTSQMNSAIKASADGITSSVSKTYATKEGVEDAITSKGYQTASDVQQKVDSLQIKFSESGGYNRLYNGDFRRGLEKWSNVGGVVYETTLSCPANQKGIRITGEIGKTKYFSQGFSCDFSEPFTLSFWQYTSKGTDGTTNPFRRPEMTITYTDGTKAYFGTSHQQKFDTWEKISVTVKPTKRLSHINVSFFNRDTTRSVYYTNIMLEKGSIVNDFSPNPNEIFDGVTTIDKDGITVTASNVKSKTSMSANGFKITKTDTNEDVFKVNADGTLALKGQMTITGGSVSDSAISSTIKNGASAGTSAKNQVDNWTYSGSTEINGNSIRTGTLSASKITTGTLDATKVSVTNLNATNIKSGTIDAARISADTLKGKTITGGTISGGTVSGATVTGGSLSIGSNFSVNSSGVLTAKSASFTGTINSGSTINGSNIRGGTLYIAADSSATNGYAFRIYDDGRVFSKKTIQVYGSAENGVYSQLTPGRVTATEFAQTPAIKTSNSVFYIGINDVAVVDPQGDNANRLEFKEISSNKYFRPCYPSVVRNGSTSYMWYGVYSLNGVSSSSDRNMKENIHYLNRNYSSANASPMISNADMFDFIKNDYILAQYNYIGHDDTKISGIAQDLLIDEEGNDNIVGQLIVNNEEALKDKKENGDGVLSINQTQLLNVTIGALQEAMTKIEALEKEVSELKKHTMFQKAKRAIGSFFNLKNKKGDERWK